MHMYSRLFWEAFSGSQHKKKGLEKRGKDKKKKKKGKEEENQTRAGKMPMMAMPTAE